MFVKTKNVLQNAKKNEQAERIKKLINDDLYNSLSQAIIKIVHTPYWLLKVYLLAFVIISSGLAAYMVINVIFTYLSYGVVATSRIIFEMPTLFPTLTFCHTNMFTSGFALNFLTKVNAEIYPNLNIFDRDQMKNVDFATKKQLVNAVTLRALQLVNSESYPDEDRKKLGHQLKDAYELHFQRYTLFI